jgi:hypothetical protein
LLSPVFVCKHCFFNKNVVQNKRDAGMGEIFPNPSAVLCLPFGAFWQEFNAADDFFFG